MGTPSSFAARAPRATPGRTRPPGRRVGSREVRPARENRSRVRQLPGDLTQNGRLEISDGVRLIRHVIHGAGELPCSTTLANEQVLDINGDSQRDLADAIFLLNYIFAGGPAPALGVNCVPIDGCPDACGE